EPFQSPRCCAADWAAEEEFHRGPSPLPPPPCPVRRSFRRSAVSRPSWLPLQALSSAPSTPRFPSRRDCALLSTLPLRPAAFVADRRARAVRLFWLRPLRRVSPGVVVQNPVVRESV